MFIRDYEYLQTRAHEHNRERAGDIDRSTEKYIRKAVFLFGADSISVLARTEEHFEF